MSELVPLPPFDTAPLFPALQAELVALLREIDPAEWDLPTVAGAWRVRDVAAHLLDGDLRKIAAHRDGHAIAPVQPIRGYDDVVAHIQHLNAGGVSFGARLSARILTDLLEITGQWVSAFVASLDPNAPALYAVAWAGETQSSNRFDTAREYTERWHHQMQIRDVVSGRGRPTMLLTPLYFVPLFETALRALPHAYRTIEAADDTNVVMRVSDAPSLSWTLRRAQGNWRLYRGDAPHVTSHASARVTAPADRWWRLFFNALAPDAARTALSCEGPAPLWEPLLRARAVMVSDGSTPDSRRSASHPPLPETIP